MIYIVLGILVVVAIRLTFYMKYLQYDMKQNICHEVGVFLFSVYFVCICNYLKDTVLPKGIDELTITWIFIPFGLFMPMLYKRFRYFLLDFILAAIVNFVICIIQIVTSGHTNFYNILFGLFGVLVGYLAYALIREIIPFLKKGLLVEKRNKRFKSLIFEGECTIAVILLFICVCFGIGNLAVGKKQVDAKGEAVSGDINNVMSVKYAISENKNRYIEYYKNNTGMSAGEVVWRVNSNLDRPFYDENYITYVDKNDDSPLLVNKFNRVSENYKPASLVKIEGDYEGTPATKQAYMDMTEDMASENMKIYVVSAYRSYDYQNNLYNYYLKKDSIEVVDTYSSRPGFSEHHTGRALDVSQVYNNLDAFEGSKEAKWVYDNCYKYGFIVRYTEENKDVTGYIFEPWHITYVGKEISTKMKEENIKSLEEYVVKYRK